MRIERVELRHVRLVLVAPFVTSMGVETDEEHIIVRVDGEGVTGWGECVAEGNPFYSYETTHTAWHILRDFLVPAVLGRDLASVDEAIALTARVRGHMMAKAGLESALWDAFAKAQGVSLSKMLGGVRERIDVGVSIGIQPTPAELLDKVAGYLDEGYRRIKIKIAPGSDLAYVKAVRREYPNIPFQVDANSAYSLETATSLYPLDDLNLLLIEQPLDEDDLWDHSQLQKRFKTPLCLDESILSARHARQALEMCACRVINIKAGRVGGLSQAVAIHDLCHAQNIPVWCGGMLETGVGRASNLALASLPGFTLPGDVSASDRYYSEDITQERFTLNPDSTIDVPDKPGLGVTIDTAALDRSTQARLQL